MSTSPVNHLKADLTLAQAKRIVEAARNAGRERDLMPLTVVVLDTGGHLIAMEREDGAGIVRLEVAQAKAWGALGMGISSRTLGSRMQGRDAFLSALAVASKGRFAPVPGGVLVLDGQSQVIGAVGVSGDASDEDEACALAGIQAAGLKSDLG